MIEEIWVDITGYEGTYQISNFGNIKSLDRVVIGKRCNFNIKGKHIIQGKNKKGYLFIRTCVNCVKKSIVTHRYVAKLFVPNPNNKKEVNHIDGDKSNNRFSNLEWTTPSENVKHAFKIGLKSHYGSKHPSSSLTEEKVIELKRMALTNKPHAEIAAHFGITVSCFRGIKYGTNWSHIKLTESA